MDSRHDVRRRPRPTGHFLEHQFATRFNNPVALLGNTGGRDRSALQKSNRLRIGQKQLGPQMIYLTQLIYLQEGKAEVFSQFEEMAIPIISKYNGRLTLRIRPNETSVIEKNIEQPYEIHLVEFDTQGDFDDFINDETRKEFLHLKEASVRSSILIQGTRIS